MSCCGIVLTWSLTTTSKDRCRTTYSMIEIVVAHFRSHSVWRFEVRWLIIAICAESLATAKADAIEIGAP